MAADTNGIVAALLRDLAAVQTSQPSMWGYKRAAGAIFGLDEPLEAYLQGDGTLRKIPNVGPKTEPIVLEVLRTGGSPTVARAVAASDKAADVATHRGLREGFLSRAQVVAALRTRGRKSPGLADYRGDLQMHSVWSDGTQTFQQIAEACLARGYRYCAVTDHSYGLRIARGLSMADLKQQQQEIDRVNRAFEGRFRIIKGIEANVMADGSVDMTRPELQQVELVVAAPHSVLRSAADQTARMVTAVTTPGVHILGHPRGRIYGSRPGIRADWDAVFAAAAQANVAVEIDGDPSRQDLDHVLAKRAVKAGCLIALDSDAHSTGDLVAAETAIAHARLAGVPTAHVVNCWELERLMDWLRR
jgi:histidinol phosphatase-like PHP family hydrolase